jgi:hypothetical protein
MRAHSHTHRDGERGRKRERETETSKVTENKLNFAYRKLISLLNTQKNLKANRK